MQEPTSLFEHSYTITNATSLSEYVHGQVNMLIRQTPPAHEQYSRPCREDKKIE